MENTKENPTDLEKVKTLLSSRETFQLGAEIMRGESPPSIQGTLVTIGFLRYMGLIEFLQDTILVHDEYPVNKIYGMRYNGLHHIEFTT